MIAKIAGKENVLKKPWNQGVTMKAIITGITGQDGSYLAEFLLSRGYEVHGTVRHSSTDRNDRINHIIHRLHLHQADLLDQLSLIRLIEEVKPNEIYNLAGHTQPGIGWRHPVICGQAHALGVSRLLEAIRLVDPEIHFFQASSSEMFDRSGESPQTERTPFCPSTPFGIAKLYAHWMSIAYRHKYGLKTCCGILFDHESPRRGEAFVTRQITQSAARIKLGLQEKLILNTLDIRSDWGFAGDFVRAFWMMLQQRSTPDDYVIATGNTHSLEDFCRIAFEAANLDWRDHIGIENSHIDSIPATSMQGDISHARRKLLWEPEVSFKQLIRMMVEADIERYSPPNRWPTETTIEERARESVI
jgi:GDPmannose 4,6-dehydratase